MLQEFLDGPSKDKTSKNPSPTPCSIIEFYTNDQNMGNENSYLQDVGLDLVSLTKEIKPADIALVRQYADEKHEHEKKEQERKAAEAAKRQEEQHRALLRNALKLNNLPLGGDIRDGSPTTPNTVTTQYEDDTQSCTMSHRSHSSQHHYHLSSVPDDGFMTDRTERDDESTTYGDETPRIRRGGRELSTTSSALSRFGSPFDSRTPTIHSPVYQLNLDSELDQVSSEGESDTSDSDDDDDDGNDQYEQQRRESTGPSIDTIDEDHMNMTPPDQSGEGKSRKSRGFGFKNFRDSVKSVRLAANTISTAFFTPRETEKKEKQKQKQKSKARRLFEQYFSLDDTESLKKYMSSILTGPTLQRARERIRKEIKSIDPNNEHARHLIRQAIRDDQMDVAIAVIEEQNYLRVPVSFKMSEFDDVISKLSPNSIPSINKFKDTLARQEKHIELMQLSAKQEQEGSVNNDQFDTVSVEKLVAKWIQVILYKFDPESTITLKSSLLTLSELTYIYQIVDNHYRFPCPLPKEQLESIDRRTDKKEERNLYIDYSQIILSAYRVLEQLREKRKTDIEKLESIQSHSITQPISISVEQRFEQTIRIQSVIRSASRRGELQLSERISSIVRSCISICQASVLRAGEQQQHILVTFE